MRIPLWLAMPPGPEREAAKAAEERDAERWRIIYVYCNGIVTKFRPRGSRRAMVGPNGTRHRFTSRAGRQLAYVLAQTNLRNLPSTYKPILVENRLHLLHAPSGHTAKVRELKPAALFGAINRIKKLRKTQSE